MMLHQEYYYMVENIEIGNNRIYLTSPMPRDWVFLSLNLGIL